ncbi:MAG: hypothetical protein ACO25F_04405 [Erythrobacter sp.]
MKIGDHRLTLLFFGLTLTLLLVMRGYFPAELARPIEGSDIRPVLLLEFASTHAHLAHSFGETGDPMRASRIAGMTTGNTLDYLLMPAYGLLTFSFFAGIARETGRQSWRIWGWIGIVAAIADAAENAIMFRMVDRFVAGADPLFEMAILPYPVWLKFGLLAASCGGAAFAFYGLRRPLLAVLCLPAPVLIVPGMLDQLGIGPLATAMIGLGWLAMAIHAASRWHRPAPEPA